jgi:hypothetical protein
MGHESHLHQFSSYMGAHYHRSLTLSGDGVKLKIAMRSRMMGAERTPDSIFLRSPGDGA